MDGDQRTRPSATPASGIVAPEQARGHPRGTEVGDLGNLGVGKGTPEEEVAALYALGIRQVTVTHSMDNKIGGAAVFEDVYNITTDLLGRANADRLAALANVTGLASHFYRVREGSCTKGELAGKIGECVTAQLSPAAARLSWDADFKHLTWQHVSLAITALTGSSNILTKIASLILPDVVRYFAGSGFQHPFPLQADLSRYGADKYNYDTFDGHLNAKGLNTTEDFGPRYVRALMSHGMLVDVSHMSDLSRVGVFGISRDFAVRTLGPDCAYTKTTPQIGTDRMLRGVVSAHLVAREVSRPELCRPQPHQGAQLRPARVRHGREPAGVLPPLGELARRVSLARPDSKGAHAKSAASTSSTTAPPAPWDSVRAYMYASEKMDGRNVGVATGAGIPRHVGTAFRPRRMQLRARPDRKVR